MIYFFHISLKPKNGVTELAVNEQMNLALDWYRYSETNWVVKSTSNIEKWQKRLISLVDDKTGFLLIMEINITKRQGWMPKTFWAWCKGENVETSKSKKKIESNKSDKKLI